MEGKFEDIQNASDYIYKKYSSDYSLENEKDKKNALRYHTENILQLNPSIGQLEGNFSNEKCQECLDNLENYEKEIKKSNY